jgi:hypothetical protein
MKFFETFTQLCVVSMVPATAFHISASSKQAQRPHAAVFMSVREEANGETSEVPVCWIIEKEDLPASIDDSEWFLKLDKPVLGYDADKDEVFLAFWGEAGELSELRWRFNDFDWRFLLHREDGTSAFCCDTKIVDELKRRAEARAETQALLSALRSKDIKSIGKETKATNDDDDRVYGTLQDLPKVKSIQDYLEESLASSSSVPKYVTTGPKRGKRDVGPESARQTSFEEDEEIVKSYFTMRHALESASYRWKKKNNQTKDKSDSPA